MRNIYDNSEFFAAYAEMGRSKDGLKAAGEWHQLQPLFPKLQGKKVLDLGCGYGWHCKFAAQMGAAEILGIDSWSYVKKKYKLNMPFLRLAYPAKASAFSSNAA